MLKITKVSFPGFGIGEFTLDSVAFELPWFGGEKIEIAWYALFITLGMVLAATYTILSAKRIGISGEDVIDFALLVIPIGVVGARLYYVFSKIEMYHSFADVVNIRHGGLAIYGGIIAGGLTVLAVCYFKKINFLAFADHVSPGVILAQGIGRWGNFMNGEAYGYETDWFCRMGLSHGGHEVMSYVHPTFLYESLWNFMGFAIAAILTGKKKRDGHIFLFVFGWYGLGRMFIEGLRTDSLYLFNTDIRVSQLLAFIIFIASIIGIIYLQIWQKDKPLYYKKSKEAVVAEEDSVESKKGAAKEKSAKYKNSNANKTKSTRNSKKRK